MSPRCLATSVFVRVSRNTHVASSAMLVNIFWPVDDPVVAVAHRARSAPRRRRSRTPAPSTRGTGSPRPTSSGGHDLGLLVVGPDVAEDVGQHHREADAVVRRVGQLELAEERRRAARARGPGRRGLRAAWPRASPASASARCSAQSWLVPGLGDARPARSASRCSASTARTCSRNSTVSGFGVKSTSASFALGELGRGTLRRARRRGAGTPAPGRRAAAGHPLARR